MIKITGNTPEFKRIETGWNSFDKALSDQTEVGYPLGQIAEIYGSNGVGKSTFVQSLALVLARETNSNIVLADFEGINTKLLIANAELQEFNGELHRIQDVRDEKILGELLSSLGDKKKQYSVGIVDAVGSISPVSEAEGDLGDANMGRRAILMAQFSRKTNHILINNPYKSVLLVNHQHPRIGLGFGTVTPGGETKKYAASIRIQLSRMRLRNKEETFPDGSYIIKGNVVKNRWGLEDRDFHLFVLAGKGVHKGLTAMYDGMIAGVVSRDRTIKIKDQNFGYLKDLITHAQAGDEDFFRPFYQALMTIDYEPDVLQGDEIYEGQPGNPNDYGDS